MDESRSIWPRRDAPPVGEVDDDALIGAVDRAVGFLDETGDGFRKPVIASRLPALFVHSLLDHGPMAFIRDDEPMQIKVETILDRGTVHLGHQAARVCERGAVETHPLACCDELVRGLSRIFPTSTTDMDAELSLERTQPTLQRTDDTRRDTGGVPVHSHHSAKRLEPERVRETAQQFVTTVMMDNRFADHRPEPGHSIGEPLGNLSTVQG